jgi:MFS family permease
MHAARPTSWRGAAGLISLTCAAIFLAALDQTVIVTALPTVISDLRIPVTNVDQFVWVVTAYLLGYTVAMPIFGRISDLAGHGLLFALALGLFIAGSVAVALAPGLTPLLAARVIQALGGGAMVPVAMALVSELLPSARRALPLGLIGAAGEAGTVLGPLWGAFWLLGWGWRSIFWINLPLGLALLGLFLWRFRYAAIPFTRPAQALSRQFDYPGAGLLTAGLAALTLAATDDTAHPRPVAWSVGLLVAGLVLLVGFALWEWRVAAPLIDPALFRRRPLALATLAHVLIGAALIVALFNIPLYAYGVLGVSAAEGGLILLRLTAAIPLGAVIGGLLVPRLGYGLPTLLGLALAAAGFAQLAHWHAAMPAVFWPSPVGPLPVMTLQLGLTGFGFGLLIAPLAAAVVNAVPTDLAGTASAVHTVARLVGMTFGLATLSSWGTGRFNALVQGLPLPLALPGEDPALTQQRLATYQAHITQAYLTVFHDVYLIAFALCLVAMIPALGLAGRRRTVIRKDLAG